MRPCPNNVLAESVRPRICKVEPIAIRFYKADAPGNAGLID